MSAKTLSAVNQMLAAIGEAPVSTLDSDNPEIATALLTLDQVNTEVQAEGWDFNTENNLRFAPDNDGFILVSNNVLSLTDNKASNRWRYQVVLRDGKLYDKRGHTFVWAEPIYCDVIWKFDFEDLPAPFIAYITARASRLFAGRTQGSEEMVAFNSQDEMLLRNSCLEYETQTTEANMLSDDDGRNIYRSYRPVQTMLEY